MKRKWRCAASRLLAFVLVLCMVCQVPAYAGPAEVGTDGLEAAAVGVLAETEFTIENVQTGKLLKTYADVDTPVTVDGVEGDAGTVFHDVKFMNYDNGDLGSYTVVNFISKDYNKGIRSSRWIDESSYDAVVRMLDNDGIGGWESIRMVPNGDGTVSFKDSRFDQYITVNEKNQLEGRLMDDTEKGELTDREKFIIHSGAAPGVVTELTVNNSSRTETTLDLSWKNPWSIYTGIELLQKGPNEFDYTKIADLTDEESYQATGLKPGSEYSFKLIVINGNGDGEDIIGEESAVLTAKTRAGVKPATPSDVRIKEAGDSYTLNWEKAENAKGYKILHAKSLFGTYEVIETIDDAAHTSVSITLGEDKYSNYYRVVAVNGEEESEQSDYASLEKEMFGDHTLIFAETDDPSKIDETIEQLFQKQNDRDTDAQFRGEHWQIYFKPGDYTETACMNLGFYTAFNGLGKTPYEVKLNNIAIPPYLDNNNSTCNFWRSAENLSVINTGNEQGKAGYDSWRADSFNWAVAQAAPLRRVYSERPIAYDWNYGWASGGYVADCYIKGMDGEGLSAGTWSGQQFYTRNSKMTGKTYGTTLNNFFQGVEASNLLDDSTGEKLKAADGYTNWGIAGENNGQQVTTELAETPRIAEKPFLYLDEKGEYQVFVPAVRENAKGISWSENDMGAGRSIPLEDFYLAKPDDTAAKINTMLAAGKHIYFTPGIYHAEEPIRVTKADTVLLGSGLATIIPDNREMAMEVSDVDGVRIAGLIFDAGEASEYLLKVGEYGSHTSHADNPTVLQDLFFRVGGTTDVLTKSDDALEINSDNVIGDHFWIWRADHGAGVEWYGNESRHGLIVNGDNVTCYALFNEHFQEYHTLWNGENGATYFYQNETCYDPISQEAWMSHDGTVKGYSSYKVANTVEKHYAVGLGIYNVFIYTGPGYDSKEVQIQLDNAIEVPNTAEVWVENACIQTFASDDGALQKINHIVNGVGGGVSSGIDRENPDIKGEGYSRKFLTYYNNGTAAFGREPQTEEEKNKFVGIEVISNITPPKEEAACIEVLQEAYEKYADIKQEGYTKESWEAFSKAREEAEELLAKGYKAGWSQVTAALEALETAAGNLVKDTGSTVKPPKDENDGNEKTDGGTTESGKNEDGKTDNGKTDQVKPENVKVTKVTLNRKSVTLNKGKTTVLKASIAPANATNKKITWRSSNSKVAVVSQQGKVKAVGKGTAKITVTTGDGQKTAVCTIKVKVPAKKLTLSTRRIYIVKGKSMKIKAVKTPSDSTDQISWKSSNKKVVTVKNGKIKAKKAGNAKITAKTTSGKKVTCRVYVVKKARKATAITLNKKKATIKKGSWILLSPKLKPSNSTDTVKWKSSNKKVAAVDAYGFVTGKKKGKATITATTKSGKKVKCRITVK